MSNLITNNSSNKWNEHLNSSQTNVATKQTVTLDNIQIKGKRPGQKYNQSPNEVTSASTGFSSGMKREMEMTSLANAKVMKKRVIIQNTEVQIDSMLVTKRNNSNQIKSVSSASEITPISDITMSTSIAQCSDNWKKIQQDLKMEETQNKKRIMSYVKDHLFKDLKFIPSPEMMIYTSDRNSLNNYVCTALNIRLEDQWNYWAKYAGIIEKAVNAARNDAVSAVKKSFLKGKTNY